MRHKSDSKAVGWWLFGSAAAVYLMIVVGGITRLTQSGLSMVEWAPIMGALPPIGEAAWMDVFNKYKAYPEYIEINSGMSLPEFKSIFWWEYGHRVLGRVIGLIYLLPLLFFIAKGMIPKGWNLKLFFLFLLGGLQGLMGWYMVKSGLVDQPHVSQYRLTAHLSLAIVIFGCMLWFSMDFLRGRVLHQRATKAYLWWTAISCGVVFLMMVSGGFVAGTKAGFIINTFPTMNGQWIPDGLLAISPVWRNYFENPVSVQFVHRFIAVIVFVVVAVTFHYSRKQMFSTRAFYQVLIMLAQVCLGVSALLLVVPVLLGAAHQAGAVALLGVSLYIAHVARKSNEA